MHLRRFRSSTVRDALALARAELGAGAFVLSTRMVSTGGWRGLMGAREVEVTAAADRPDVAVAEEPAGVGLTMGLSAWATKRARPAEDAADGRAALTARLMATGLERGLAEDIARAVPGSARRDADDTRLQRAVVETLEPIAAGAEERAAIELFLGPPGAGKTTTIAKIAAQARAGRGRRLLLVSADGQRPGAVEQLRAYAEIIGVPFAAARAPHHVLELVAEARTPLLIDTPGRSVAAGQYVEPTFELLARRLDVRVHLVVAAATSPRQLERLLEVYRRVKPERLVLTRLDEAESIAPLMGYLRRRQLPLSFLGTGQQVPEDLLAATPTALAEHLLGPVATPELTT